MAAAVSLKAKISAHFELVAKEQNQTLSPLSDDLVLLESGLDSLCFAIIVARLEDELGYDPFTAAGELEFPITFGDFVRIYHNAAN
ncbi:MAG: acyl carrier protein [Candidatus Binataceae bacterium]|nr:acyl carrier protein [Candidatus Binataceae bacterium]